MVTLKPVPRWSAFAELDARSRRFRLALFYEGYRVGQSPVKRIGTIGLLQPQSNEDIIGVSLAWCCRQVSGICLSCLIALADIQVVGLISQVMR